MKINYLKLFLILFIGLYFFYYAFTPEQWNLIDNVNLLIHEAGHFLLSSTNQTLYIAGGSFLQLLIPSLFAGYFFFRKEVFSGSIVLFWVGQNFLNVSAYAGDAVKMNLPLLGGNENVIHDWNFLLTHFGILEYTNEISLVLKTIGLVFFALAVFLGTKECFKNE